MTELLQRVWREYPDWRLAQAVLNAHAASEAAAEASFAQDDGVEHGLRRLPGSSPHDRDRIAKAHKGISPRLTSRKAVWSGTQFASGEGFHNSYQLRYCTHDYSQTPPE
jgi:hypothetical protein